MMLTGEEAQQLKQGRQETSEGFGTPGHGCSTADHPLT